MLKRPESLYVNMYLSTVPTCGYGYSAWIAIVPSSTTVQPLVWHIRKSPFLFSDANMVSNEDLLIITITNRVLYIILHFPFHFLTFYAAIAHPQTILLFLYLFPLSLSFSLSFSLCLSLSLSLSLSFSLSLSLLFFFPFFLLRTPREFDIQLHIISYIDFFFLSKSHT